MIESSWIHIGLHGGYHWLEVEGDTHISLLVRAFPELVHDRFIAATAFSGGIPQLAEADQAAGWMLRNEIGYSPKLSEGFQRYYVEDPPSVFDEWYVLEAPKDLGERVEGAVFDQPPSEGRTLVFANWLVFRLSEGGDDSTDFLRAWFWQQMEWIQPEAFVSEAPGCWILVTKDEDLIARVADYLYDIAS